MDSKRRRRLEPRADVFKALGHPSRLLIVQELAGDDRNVSELTDAVGARASTVSRHLSVLKGAGLLSSEKRGTEVTYSLRVPCVMEFLVCVDKVLAEDGR